MKEINVKYLIIGAGVSGLAFANNLKSEEYLILEKENEPGGYCRTIKKDGFIWDYAGHFFHFANKEIKSYFESRIPKEDFVRVDKCTKIYFKGNLVDYPFQKNIHQLSKEDFIDCLYWLFNKEEKAVYNSFMDMLYGKFGRGITERFLKPYNEKLYACDLNTLDQHAMGRFFPDADIKQIIDNMKNKDNNSYNNSFLYPKNGAYEFVKVLLSDLNDEKILFNQEIINIDLDKKTAYTKNCVIQYKYLINTSSLKNLLRISHKPYDVLQCNKVLVFNLGFDKKSKFCKEHWMYFPEEDFNFYRVGFYDNILGQDRLSMYIEIGYKENEDIDVDKQLNLTLGNLKKSGIIDDHQLVSYSVCIMNPAYVHISTEAQKYVDNIQDTLNAQGVYSIGRYGAWKYCSVEDCIIEANELYKRIGN